MDLRLGIPVKRTEKIISEGSMMAVLKGSASWDLGEKWNEGKGDSRTSIAIGEISVP